MKNRWDLGVTLVVAGAVAGSSQADVALYGDMDVLGTGSYASDPRDGATLNGLAPNAVTLASLVTSHSFPFAPDVGDYPGTDQIYVGSNQTSFHDGYSAYSGRLSGPHIVDLDYSHLVPAGEVVSSLTLGIGADDFEFSRWGQPFSSMVNGVSNGVIAAQLEGLNQTGPRVQFFTVGIELGVLRSDHTLTLTIDEGGDGGDGWAIDFLTIGVTTIPTPGTASLVALAGFGGLRRSRR